MYRLSCLPDILSPGYVPPIITSYLKRGVGFLLLLGLFLGLGNRVFAQLPPNQIEQDCIGAIPVCQNVYTQPNSYQGQGLNDNEINSAISCLNDGERNGVWYIFTVEVGGDLCFTITPVNPADDYDWALFNLTNASCSDIFSDPTIADSCNYFLNLPGCNGITGANNMHTGTSICRFQNTGCVPVNTGETFVLYVSNFMQSNDGYTLDFSASTANIFDSRPPQIAEAGPGCGNNQLEVTFSENVRCGTVDPADFTVTGPGGSTYSVTSVFSGSCLTGGQFSKDFSLTLSPPVTVPGIYTVSLVGLVEDNCGNVGMASSASTSKSLEIVFAPDTICAGQSTTLSTSVSNLPGYAFNWTPGNLTAASPLVSPTTTTTYQVQILGPDGCSNTYTKTVNVKASPTTTFTLTPTACAGTRAQVQYTGSGSASATYVWDFDGGIIASGSGAGPYEIVWNTPGSKNVQLIVEENGCTGAPATQTIEISQIPTASFSILSEICAEDSTTILYTGNASPNATYNWSIPGFPGQVSTPGPIKIAYSSAGTRRIELQVEENGCFSSLSGQNIDIIPKPSLQITAVSDQCVKGNSFQFEATGSSADTYNWVFGASAKPAVSSQALPPSVSYQTPGEKEVYLVATQNGCLGDTTRIDFEVIPQPSADFLISSTNGCSGQGITFSYQDTALGPNQTFLWEFGAAAAPAIATSPTPPAIQYLTSGQKTITLTTSYRGCTESTSQTVTVNASPFVDAGNPKNFCEGDGGVKLDGSVRGGTAPYFYNWTCSSGSNCGIDSAAVATPTVNPAITAAPEVVTYYFQAIDRNGCASGIDSVQVTVKAKPFVDAGPDVSLCPESAFGAQLQGGLFFSNRAPEPVTYLWVPQAGINDPTDPNAYARPDTTTIYTLVASSQNGCSSDVNTLSPLSTVRVEVLPNPRVEAGLDTGLCLGDSIQLRGFATGAGPTYTYNWTPFQPDIIANPTSRSPVARPLASTLFTLTVTSTNGCAGSDSVLVQVDAKPTVSAGLDRDLCQNDTLQLEGLAQGDLNASSYSLSWSPSIGLSDSSVARPLASPDLTTTYTVVASSPFGCLSDPDEVTLTALPTPVVSLLQTDTTLCEGDSIRLEAPHEFFGPVDPAVRYTWTPVATIGTTISDSIVFVKPTQPTRIEVTAATLNGRCSTTDAIFVQVDPAVAARITADTNRLCEGDNVRLVATGDLGSGMFTWQPTDNLSDPSVSNPLASPDTTTTYVVTISEGVCSDQASFTLIVNPAPGADYFSSLTEGCESLTVNFLENAPNAVAYVWDFGDGSPISNEPNPTHTFAEPGSYTVTLTTFGIGGCTDQSSQATIQVNAPPSITATAVPDQGELTIPAATIQFASNGSPANGYYWEFGDGQASNDSDVSYTYTRGGVYTPTLTITDSIGCENTLSLGPFIIIEPNVLVPNVFTPNGDQLNDQFLTGYIGTASFRLEIQDRYGRQVFSTTSPTEGWDGTVSGNEAGEGVYFYTLIIDQQTYRGELTLLR